MGNNSIEELLLVIILLICTVWFPSISKRDGYKQGQIDAMQGKIKYRLSRNENGEEVWTKIEE